MGLFDSIISGIDSVAGSIEGGISDAIKDVVGEPVSLIQDGLQEAYQGLSTGAEDLFDVFSGAGSFMWDALEKAPEGLLNEFEAFPGQIWGGIKGFGEDAIQAPENLIDDLKNLF